MVGLYRRAINDRPYDIIDTPFDKRQFIRESKRQETGWSPAFWVRLLLDEQVLLAQH